MFGTEYPAQKSIDPDTVPDEFGPWFKYDPDEAKKLLAAAGWETGLSWTHRGPAGFTGETTSQDALWLQDMQAIGVDVEFANPESVNFTTQYYGGGFRDPEKRATESIQGWSTATPTRNGYFWENIHSASSVNHFDTRDPEVDRLADLQRSEGDPDQRQEYIRQIFDYFNDQGLLDGQAARNLDRHGAAAGVAVLPLQCAAHRHPLVLGLGLRGAQGVARRDPHGIADDQPAGPLAGTKTETRRREPTCGSAPSASGRTWITRAPAQAMPSKSARYNALRFARVGLD